MEPVFSSHPFSSTWRTRRKVAGWSCLVPPGQRTRGGIPITPNERHTDEDLGLYEWDCGCVPGLQDWCHEVQAMLHGLEGKSGFTNARIEPGRDLNGRQRVVVRVTVDDVTPARLHRANVQTRMATYTLAEHLEVQQEVGHRR